MQIYVVKPGDTLFSVAARFGLTSALLAGLNGVGARAQLVVGQTLVVRSPRTVHTVAPGDTLYSVARRYGVSTRALYRNNFALGGRPALRAGETLVISFADDDRLGAIRANGYAYPYIDGALLDAELPYLSYMTPFTYGISQSGGLLP